MCQAAARSARRPVWSARIGLRGCPTSKGAFGKQWSSQRRSATSRPASASVTVARIKSRRPPHAIQYTAATSSALRQPRTSSLGAQGACPGSRRLPHNASTLRLGKQRDLVDEVVIHVVEEADVADRRAPLLDDRDRQLVEAASSPAAAGSTARDATPGSRTPSSTRRARTAGSARTDDRQGRRQTTRPRTTSRGRER